MMGWWAYPGSLLRKLIEITCFKKDQSHNIAQTWRKGVRFDHSQASESSGLFLFFQGEAWAWNCLDLVIVGSALFETVVQARCEMWFFVLEKKAQRAFAGVHEIVTIVSFFCRWSQRMMHGFGEAVVLKHVQMCIFTRQAPPCEQNFGIFRSPLNSYTAMLGCSHLSRLSVFSYIFYNSSLIAYFVKRCANDL